MKRTHFLLFFLLSLTSKIFAQQRIEEMSVRFGYGTTNIGVKEAYERSASFFGLKVKSGKTFIGEGVAYGVSKEINHKLTIDIAYSGFKGEEQTLRVNNVAYYYKLGGHQIPITINYLTRDSSKRLRINLGLGAQYLNGNLKQFQNITNGANTITNKITDINISEVQLAFKPGIQFRIFPQLFALYTVTFALSANGRYLDNPCLSLKYSFTKLSGKEITASP